MLRKDSQISFSNTLAFIYFFDILYFIKATIKKMTNKEKSIHIIEYSGKKTDWDSWSEKSILHGKRKGYKKLLVSTGSMPGMDKIPTQEGYEDAINKKILKFGELNKLVYEDLILSIHNQSHCW